MTSKRGRGRMKEHTATAFAPGHLTAFFMIADSPQDPLARGSLGSGMCLTKGAYTTITIREPDPEGRKVILAPEVTVLINGEQRTAEVTTFALEQMASEATARGLLPPGIPMLVAVDTLLELPERSGWGMSGAGALSSALALREALNLPFSFYETAAFAHRAELEHATGLGDVAAQCTGGIDIRVRPGIPPHGFIDSIPARGMEVVCLSLPEPLSTNSVLQDPGKRKLIDRVGRVAVDGILQFPTVDMFFEYARSFTMESGLAGGTVLEAVRSIRGAGRGGMAMLGNSVFAVGDTETLVTRLSAFGRVDVCEVDPAGARVT